MIREVVSCIYIQTCCPLQLLDLWLTNNVISLALVVTVINDFEDPCSLNSQLIIDVCMWVPSIFCFFSYSFSIWCQLCEPFLLSEHRLCKESIVIAKKFDFEILTYLYVFRSPKFIYAIFSVMYGCVCACVCVYVSEYDSV